MNRRSAMRTLAIAGAASFLSRASGQDEPFTLRSDVRLVLLDVAVKDREGGFAIGLSKENFVVTENGKRQTITTFADEDVPVTVGLLVDESRSMAPKRDDVLAAAHILIQKSNPHDEIFVLNFNDDVKRGLPADTLFSDNPLLLGAALDSGQPQGMTAMNDAVIDGLQQLQQGRRDKKALVLISDGGDNASRNSRQDMLDLVEKSLATIYTIGIYDPGDQDRNPGILKRLAAISGGESYFPDDPSKMPAVCTAIAKEIRTRYTIGYIPPPPANSNDMLRRIHVAVSAPARGALTARTRTSYLYDLLGTMAKK